MSAQPRFPTMARWARVFVVVCITWAIPPALEAAPRVRIVPIPAFDAMPLELGQPGSWSPRGTRLVLRRELKQLWVLDVSQPDRRPEKVYDTNEWIRSYGWSPDGEWLQLVVGDPSPNNDRMLVAVPLGGRPDTLITGTDIVEAFWGSDGRLHYRVGYEWKSVPPPARWKPAAWFVPRPVPFISGQRLTLSLGPNPGGPHPPAHLGTFKDDTRMFVVDDALPDGSQWIMHFYEDTIGAWRLVNGRGGTVLDLSRFRVMPTAIDRDTGMIVGFWGEGPGGESGWTRTWLKAIDGRGRWSATIDGGDGGSHPQMSREGSFIAYRGRLGTGVGQLVVEGR